MVNSGLESVALGHGTNVHDPTDPVAPVPHAVLFPYPAQGHINPMMHLARKLVADGFFVTFVNTNYNHRRIFSTSNNNNNNNDLNTPNLRFLHIPDGLPESHGRFNENMIETTAAALALSGPLTDLLKGLRAEDQERPDRTASTPPPPVSCIIGDSFCSWVQDVADELGVPRVAFWTTPAHANLAYHFMSLLIDRGYVPLADRGKAESEVPVTCVPGVAPMKLHDYISFFLASDSSDALFQWTLHAFMRRVDEAVWNLGNTWAELDAAADAALASEVPGYAPIGPLLPDAILGSTVTATMTATTTAAASAPAYPSARALPAASSLWAEDSSCLDWLSGHGEGTVLYISFGSIAHVAAEELEALVQGIQKSGVPFLWALRPDQGGKVLDSLRAELSSGELAAAGRLVAWAPQLAVLAHRAVGGFLTHCGWNSVLESIAAGVPMLARAGGFAEQRMNAHYVADVWKVGLRMHEGVGADEVARLVTALMAPADDEGCDVRRRVAELRTSAADAAAAGGSSAVNYRRFVADMQRRVHVD